MSLEKIVEEAMAGRPLEMKEAFGEEIQKRIQEALEARFVEMMEAKAKDDEDEDEDDEEDEDLDEAAGGTHTVSIDHMGDYARDANAKKHNITLKRTSKSMPHVHDATGKKKDLQKYLAKHYDSHNDAKDMHPDVFKESADSDMVGEMKKLHASACNKTEMYAKMKEKYGCDKEKFEGLYASNCSD